MCGMVLFGTLYPLLLDALDAGKISVGPPYFGTLFALLLVPLVLALPFGFHAFWREDRPKRLLRELAIPALAGVLAGATAWAFLDGVDGWGVVAVAGGIWTIAASARWYLRRFRAAAGSRPGWSETAMTLAHVGIGIFIIGAGLTNTISSEKHLRMTAGDRFEMAGYEYEFHGTRTLEGANYVADEGEFVVFRDGREVTTLHPQKRRYLQGGQVMTEAAIDPGLTRDLYISLGEPLDETGKDWAVRIYHKPFVRFIWLGALLMAAGGVLAASDPRYRARAAEAGTVVAGEAAEQRA
jgi:cytochrome c-type biogenesis protein CcmF